MTDTNDTIAEGQRLFVRFGNLPEGGRSRLWRAPNASREHRVGATLPGVSVYEVRKVSDKLDLDTEPLNVGSGRASLVELFYRHVCDQSLPIFLLEGTPVRWMDLDKADRKEFETYWPGNGRRAAAYDLAGTDGEPMLREHRVVGMVSIGDLVCETICFPEDYIDELDEFAPATLAGP